MKRIIIFVAIALLSCSLCYEVGLNASILDSYEGKPQKDIFKAFHYFNNKEYELNSEEALTRYRIFKQNLKWIDEENKKLGKTIYGITQFTDMTHEEFVEKRLVKPEIMEAGLNKRREQNPRFLKEENSNNDKEVHYHYSKNEGNEENHNLKGNDVDWRKWDGPVKNQKACGSCWAFTALGAIENVYNKFKGKYTSFSEQYVMDCNHAGSGCEGGWMPDSYDFMIKDGILAEEHLPYKAKQGACENSYKSYQYKILKGYKSFYEGYPYYSDASWEELMAQGPLAVAMDASFRGFGWYRPKQFDAIVPDKCVKVTHAVVAVATVTENGKQYIICRNSWGANWGYKGYFKIPKEKNCLLTRYGFLPEVYDGHVPDKDPPKPEPPKQDCVEIYSHGFSRKPRKILCDSALNGGGSSFCGIKYPEHRATNKPLSIRLFYYTHCYGRGDMYNIPVTIEESTEYPKYEGKTQYSSSLAFFKPADENCVNFYVDECFKGQSIFSLCNDIKDSQDVNISELSKVKSFVMDNNNIRRISFYDQPHFRGGSFSVGNESPVYNIGIYWRLQNWLKENKVRSIKIHRY